MTPEEKANELISEYGITLPTKYNNIVKIWDYNISLAKQCALIAVDEILEDTINIYYWQEVKQEIEKL